MKLKAYTKAYTLAAAVSLLGLAFAVPSRADLIKQSATYTKTFLVTDSSGNNVTGLASGAFTVTLSKAGAASSAITPTITEIGAGRYAETLTTANTGTLGALDQIITAAGAQQVDTHDQVVAFDPSSGANLGLSALPTVAPGAAGGIPTGDAGGNVGLKTGQNVATVGGLAPPTNWTLTSIDGSGRYLLQPAQPGVVIPRVTLTDTLTTYTGNTPQTGDTYVRLGAPVGASHSADLAAVKADTGTLTTRIPGTVQPQTGDAFLRLGAPTGASVVADIHALPSLSGISGLLGNLDAPISGIPAAVAASPGLSASPVGTTGTSTPALTNAQLQALLLSVQVSNYDATAPVAGGTATFKYYLVGRPHTTPYLTETAVVTYDSNKVPVTRNVTIASPFPGLN